MDQYKKELVLLVLYFLELSESLLKDKVIDKKTFDEITKKKENFLRGFISKGA